MIKHLDEEWAKKIGSVKAHNGFDRDIKAFILLSP